MSPTSIEVSPCQTASAALALLDQCASFINSLGPGAYTHQSPMMFNGTIGQHVRHSLDHFVAALTALEGLPIVYDRRERGTKIESEPSAALELIESLRRPLLAVDAREGARAVRVRVMLTAAGDETEIGSTLDRELAFASHHAVHHHAMMVAICHEMKQPVLPGFGKAPSTLNFERN